MYVYMQFLAQQIKSWGSSQIIQMWIRNNLYLDSHLQTIHHI